MLGVTRRVIYNAVDRGELQAHRLKPKEGTAADSRNKLYFTKQDVIAYVQWKYGD